MCTDRSTVWCMVRRRFVREPRPRDCRASGPARFRAGREAAESNLRVAPRLSRGWLRLVPRDGRSRCRLRRRFSGGVVGRSSRAFGPSLTRDARQSVALSVWATFDLARAALRVVSATRRQCRRQGHASVWPTRQTHGSPVGLRVPGLASAAAGGSRDPRIAESPSERGRARGARRATGWRL